MIPLALIFLILPLVLQRMQNRQTGFLSLGKNKARVYMRDDIDVRFKDAAGVDEAKQELAEVVDFLKTPERYTRIGGKIPRGILLVGPPGTGKTLLAKAVAGESGVLFFSLSGSEFVEMFVGMGAARVRDLFAQAKEKAPAIVFIDELDALGNARGNGLNGGHDEREQTLITQEEKEIVAYHELGHAITAMALKGTDPVQKNSIVPRGIAALGYTHQTPTEDRFLMRRTELLNRITTLLGGRAAEKIIFGDVTTGAQNDLMRATDIARSMVAAYGMSERLGQVYLTPKETGAYLMPVPSGGAVHSLQTAERIDQEIRCIIDSQYTYALAILQNNLNLMKDYAKKLLDEEIIEGDEIKLLEQAVDKRSVEISSNKCEVIPPAKAA